MLRIDEDRRKVEIELANEMTIEPLVEYDLPDMTSSEDGALAHASDSVNNRDNLSGFSKSQVDVEDGKEKTDISIGGLSGFSSALSPELESLFAEDIPVHPSIEEDEAFSISKSSKSRSIFSSSESI